MSDRIDLGARLGPVMTACIGVATRGVQVPHTPAGASAMVASDLMSERVQALGGDHPRFIIRWRRLVASIAALVVLLTLGLAVPSATKTPPLVPVHRIVVPSRS